MNVIGPILYSFLIVNFKPEVVAVSELTLPTYILVICFYPTTSILMTTTNVLT